MTHRDKEYYWNLIWTLWALGVFDEDLDMRVSMYIHNIADEQKDHTD